MNNSVDAKNKLLFKFSIYMVFVIIIIFLIIVAGNKNNIQNKTIEESSSGLKIVKTYIDMQQDLINYGKYNLESNELYENIDKELLDFKKLFDKLNKNSTIINKRENSKIYNYSDIDGYKIKVYMNDEYIFKLLIEKDDIIYEINITY